MLGHNFIYVVVVTVLDAGADAPGPRGPEAVADPALAEGGHACGRPVRGIAGVESIGEIVVVHLDRVAAGGYPREKIPVSADGREGRVVLDPAQSTYARLVVSIRHLLMGRASGCANTAGAISLSDTRILALYGFDINILLVYHQCMGKSIQIDGKRLQELRVERALSLRALGERSGVAYDTINKLELGRRPAHASTIRKLADALGVEPRELMKGEE